MIGLDDVSVVAASHSDVPKPASFALIGAALLGAGLASRKRKA